MNNLLHFCVTGAELDSSEPPAEVAVVYASETGTLTVSLFDLQNWKLLRKFLPVDRANVWRTC